MRMKKLISLMLVLAMLVSLFSGVSMSVLAADDPASAAEEIVELQKEIVNRGRGILLQALPSGG